MIRKIMSQATDEVRLTQALLLVTALALPVFIVTGSPLLMWVAAIAWVAVGVFFIVATIAEFGWVTVIGAVTLVWMVIEHMF